MKSKTKGDLRHFRLRILTYGNTYYVDRVAKLEKLLSRQPRMVQIDLVGVGEIPADTALRIRSVLMQRSPKTRIITNAQSSLQNSSVLVWLLGDTRIIRRDARLFFRSADESETAEVKPDEAWKGDPSDYCDSYSCADPEEGDYARVLELINEYLPVNEMAGRLIGLPVLRQFGLVENEHVDQFLATAFAEQRKTPKDEPGGPRQDRPECDSKPAKSVRAGR